MYILVDFLNDTINAFHNNCRLDIFILIQDVIPLRASKIIRSIYYDTKWGIDIINALQNHRRLEVLILIQDVTLIRASKLSTDCLTT